MKIKYSKINKKNSTQKKVKDSMISKLEFELKATEQNLSEYKKGTYYGDKSLKELTSTCKKLHNEIKNLKILRSDKNLTFFKLIKIYYTKYYIMSGLMVFVTILSSICAVTVPKLTQLVLDAAAPGSGRDLNYIYLMAGIIFSIFIIRGIFIYINSYIGGSLGKRIEINLRNKLLTNLVELDMSFYSDKKIGEILTKLISDTEVIGLQSQSIPQSILSALFVSIGSVVVMFTINIKLTILAIGLIIFMLLCMTILFTFLRKSIFTTRATLTKINGDVTDRISNINLIKSNGTETYETKRFYNLHTKYYNVSKIQVRYQALLISFLVVFLTSVNIIILLVGIVLWKNGSLGGWGSDPIAANDPTGYSVVVAAMTGVSTLVLPIMSLSRIFSMVAQASAASTRVANLVKIKSKIDAHPEFPKLTSVRNDIVFKNVTFEYPSSHTPAFKNFNFTFEKGKKYAIVGETGSGKSTIARLLLRYYDPNSGEILINKDKNLATINLSSYLANVGYVDQEPSILVGTVMDNIKYSNFAASDEEVIEATKKASLHNFIKTLKKGYNTQVGERGFILSGGQKQRMVIARTFLKDPDILILDEATSALDNIIEKEIQQNLDSLMQNRTTFVIAHRLSTIKNADQILVIAQDKGVVQVGTYDELKKRPGHFQDLYKAGLMK